MINIEVSNESLSRAYKQLSQVQSKFPQAVARAVNRTMDGMRTDAVRGTTAKYFVKSSAVRSSLSFRKAAPGNLMGAMISRDKRHSLAEYKLTPTTPTKGKRPNIKGAVKKAGGLKPLSRAFMVKRGGGRYFLYYRIGYDSGNRQRGGIHSYISPSMPQIIKNEETVKAIQEGAQERFSKRLDHEIIRITGISL